MGRQFYRLGVHYPERRTVAVNMFHIQETLPAKVRWCWLVQERGTSTASPRDSTVLVSRVVTL